MKNVGRYPDQDRSLSHLQLANNRLAEVSMTNEQIQQMLDTRVADYVTPAQVDAEAATKLSKSALATDASRYISQSHVGVTYASLLSGNLPASQRPSDPKTLYLEAIAPQAYNGPTNTFSAYGTSKVSVGSFSVSDPGYAWIPIIFAGLELRFHSGTPPAIMTIEDSQGRVVAGGMSTRSTENQLNRINIAPESIPTAYLGAVTFTFKLRFRDGTGQVRATNAFSNMMVIRAPWNA